MNPRHLIFVVITIGMFLAGLSPRIANTMSQPGPQQKLRYDVRYTCDGDTIIVGHCRHDSDTPDMPRTKPEDDYCMVYYPDRPLQNGLRVQKTELLGDLIKRLQACGAFNQPSATKQTGRQPPGALSGTSNQSATSKSGSTPAMTRKQADSYEKYLNEGNSYLDAKKYGEAILAYKQAIAVLPDIAYAHNGLGLAYSGLGKYLEAVPEFEEAVRLDPEDPKQALHLGMTYLALHDYTKSITPIQRLIRLKPKDDKPHELLGMAYKGIKEYDKAVAAFRDALRLNPRNSSAWAGLGFTYYYLNRDPDAVSAFQQAILINPKDSYAYRGLGLTYVGQGRKNDALAAYKTLLTLDKSEAQRLYESISKMSSSP